MGYLLPRLVGGRHNDGVADGERHEEINDVRELRGQLGQRLCVEAHGFHLAGAVVHLVQELRVGRDVLLLKKHGEPHHMITVTTTKMLAAKKKQAPVDTD